MLHTKNHHYYLCVLAFILMAFYISGCYQDPDPDPDLEEIIEEGIRQQQILSLEKNEENTFIASTLSDTGSEVFLFGGDALIAETSTYRSMLSQDKESRFYFAEHPENLQGQTLDFSIEYLPVETRADRWYPVDEAYVDIGPGSYTYLTWQNTVDFPEAPDLKQPIEGKVYTSVFDRVNISWDANLQGSDNLQIWAAFDCYKKSFKIYPDKTDPITNNGFSISIDDLFDAVTYRDYHDKTFDLTQNFVDILFYGKVDPSTNYYYEGPDDCNINIHAFIQSIEAANEPFVSGEVFYHRSHTKTINFNSAVR